MKKVFSIQKVFFTVALISIAVLAGGCSLKKEEASDKMQDVDFTVVEEIDIPEEVKALIEEKKANPFQVAFTTKDASYIVVGYGEQPTGGYSITVDEFYLAEDGIHIITTLLGPEKDAAVDAALSYPYIVLKTQLTEEEIIFQS